MNKFLPVFELFEKEFRDFESNPKKLKFELVDDVDVIKFNHYHGIMEFYPDGTFEHINSHKRNFIVYFFPQDTSYITVEGLNESLTNLMSHLRTTNKYYPAGNNKNTFNKKISSESSTSTNHYDREALSYYKSRSEIEGPFTPHMGKGGVQEIRKIIFEVIKESHEFFVRVDKDESIIGVRNGIVSLYSEVIDSMKFKNMLESIIGNLRLHGYSCMTKEEFKRKASFQNRTGAKGFFEHVNPNTKEEHLMFSFRVSTGYVKEKEKGNE